MLGEEFRGKSCYANFFKLKNNIMLGEFHVSRSHVRRGLGVNGKNYQIIKQTLTCGFLMIFLQNNKTN